MSEDSLEECCAEANKEAAMSFIQHRTLSRRGFCLCCVAAAGSAATGGWFSPSQAYAEARNIVDMIRDDAARPRSSCTRCDAMSVSSKG